MADFDWVTALFSCSSAKVFEELKLQVQNDVRIRNEMRSRYPQYEYQIVSNGGSFTVVFVQGSSKDHAAVTFRLTEKGFAVGNTAGESFDVILTLNDEGECVPKINGKELQFWQMRKMVLEDLFRLGPK